MKMSKLFFGDPYTVNHDPYRGPGHQVEHHWCKRQWAGQTFCFSFAAFITHTQFYLFIFSF